MAVHRPPPQPFIGGAQPLGPKQPFTPGASANQVALPGAGSLVITGQPPTVTQSGGAVVLPGAGALVITGFAPTVVRAGSGTLTTPVMKNNTGTVLASETSVICNVYDQTTGTLIVHKTGLTSDVNGIVTFTDPLIALGTTYSYEIVLVSNGRRLPTATAT